MNKWDDAYNEELDKSIRIIKDYDLVELSLVDSPANQFASIMSVEKVDGVDVIKGDETVLENVFYDKESGLVVVSEEETHISPTTGEEMTNIGFVEKTDKEKVDMIKFLVDNAKGIHTSKITKEVNPMSETTQAVLDTAVETAEITPEAQPAEVLETPVDVEKTVAVEEVVAETSTNGSVEEVEVAAEDAAKSDHAVANAIVEIKESLANAFGDLASTVKSLHEQVVALNKSLETVSSEVKTVSDEVNNVKGTFNEFGKRVDAVEHDTAFRKSGDLGEIVQFEPAKVQKSLWGGRFLKSTDLLN
jgi:archaellum component FlaC